MSTVLVTGANRGIGLALARRLAARGDAVHAVVRRPSAELAALDATVHADIELSDPAALARLDRELGSARFDRLLLNAGVLRREPLEGFDAAAAQRVVEQFVVNALAPLQLVATLRPRLAAGAKIGLVTSRMGSIGDNSSGGYYGYRMSKAALNAAGMSLAHDLRGAGIAVFLLHPGYVRTDMTGGAGERSPDEAAAGLLQRMDALGLAQSGSFWHADGTPLPW
jgi:NAD(P)-dependent dehydrogenase (short-subunit alcohol dehydrogenase family)